MLLYNQKLSKIIGVWLYMKTEYKSPENLKLTIEKKFHWIWKGKGKQPFIQKEIKEYKQFWKIQTVTQQIADLSGSMKLMLYYIILYQLNKRKLC